MNIFEYADRYAQALIHLPGSEKDLEQREALLSALGELWENTPLLRRLLAHPNISFEIKKNCLLKCIPDVYLLHLSLLLVKRGKIGYLPLIAQKFRLFVSEKRQIMDATVISATPLEIPDKTQLQSRLEKKYQKRCILKEKIDPNLLGGAILVIRNTLLDYSLKGRLNKMKNQLAQGSY